MYYFVDEKQIRAVRRANACSDAYSICIKRARASQVKPYLTALCDIVFAQREQYVNLSIPTREDNTLEKTGTECRDGTGILIGSGLVCVYAVSVETQSRCGSVAVHSHGTCQAGINVGQTPPGHLLSSSISLSLIHSLLGVPQRRGYLSFLTNNPLITC